MKLWGFNSKHSLVKILALILSLILSSCMQNGGLRGRSLSSVANGNLKGRNGSGTVNNATGENATPGIGTGTTSMTQMVELSHFVDPFDGSYKKKLTIPKNFQGNLYISGLNVASLASKLIKVRFNFGRERQSVALSATLARAPGIVPNTAIQVLVVDMNSVPFANMRLGYDLYDYNDYNANTSLDVASDPRDGGLYCRGLHLEDDPTFLQGQGTICNGSVPVPVLPATTSTPAVCKYAYAKVTDATLQYYIGTVRYDKMPTRPLVWGAAEAAPAASTTFMSNMCLPDLDLASFNSLIPAASLPASLYFNFPYRHINDGEWEIKADAIFSISGLYINGALNTATGLTDGVLTGDRYQSLLFPRAGKLELGPNINYYGSSTKFATRSPQISDSSGITQYVDGCNVRTMEYDPSTNEGIGSCNVSATIEVFYMNTSNQEVSITKDYSLKLQLIRPSTRNYLGKEVLASSFKSCSSSTTCGASECCYNNRCWSKDLVTQCVDQLPIVGNQVIGANCTSDYECTSLCCNTSTGSCAPHNPSGAIPNFCAKSPGQQCVTKEFCRKDFVSECKVTYTNQFKLDGISRVCSLRCTPVENFGTCLGTGVRSTCVPPTAPKSPTTAEVDACTGAVDP